MSKTVQQILDKVKDDLEFKNSEAYGERSLDPMVSDNYLIGKINDSLQEVQSYIMAEYEDYFLTYFTASGEVGKSEYSLPTDIMINKIRRCIWHDRVNHLDPSANRYPVRRITSINDAYEYTTGSDYGYMLIDRPVTGDALYETKQVILPPVRSTNDYFTTWYIREMESVSATGDIISIPFIRYMEEDIKYKCLEKDVGNPMAGLIAGNRAELLELMKKSIANKIPDDQSGYMRADRTHYDSSVL